MRRDRLIVTGALLLLLLLIGAGTVLVLSDDGASPERGRGDAPAAAGDLSGDPTATDRREPPASDGGSGRRVVDRGRRRAGDQDARAQPPVPSATTATGQGAPRTPTGGVLITDPAPLKRTPEELRRDLGAVGVERVPISEPIARLGAPPPWRGATSIYGVAFSPDGREALTAGRDNLLKLWDVLSGQIKRQYEGHTGWVTGAAFTPDGRRVASTSVDGTARIWDKSGGHTLVTLKGHTDGVEAIAFSTSGTRCVTASRDDTVRLWDSATGREVRVLTGHTDDVNTVAFAPNSARVLSGSRDGKIRLWDVDTGKALKLLTGHTDFVRSVAFSPDGKRALSGSHDRTVRLWDLETGKTLFVYAIGGPIEGVAFVPGLPLAVAAGEGPGRVLSLESATVLRELPQAHDDFTALAVTRDGRLAIAAGYAGALIVWNIATGDVVVPPQPESQLAHDSDVLTVDISADATRAVSGDVNGVIKIWNVLSSRAIRTLAAGEGAVHCTRLSPDGGQIASGGADGVLRIWHAGSGAQIHALDTKRAISTLAWRPDGNLLLAAHGPAVAVWDPNAGERMGWLGGHTSDVERIVFRGDGLQVATGGRDRKLHLWAPETRAIDTTIEPGKGWITSQAYLPGGGQLLVGLEEGLLQRYEARGGEPLWSVSAHTLHAGIEALLVTPDGRRAITASQDRVIGIFDVEDGALLHTLRAHVEPITDLALSADGQTLLSSSIDRSVYVWRVPD